MDNEGTQKDFQGDTTVDIVIMIELTQHCILVRFSRLSELILCKIILIKLKLKLLANNTQWLK